MTNSPIQSEPSGQMPAFLGLIVVPLVCFVAACGYGALGPLIPLIIIKVLLIVVAVAICGTVVGAFKRGLVFNAVLGLLGAVAAVAGLWFGWLWQEFGFGDAAVLYQGGPTFLYQYLVDLSADYTYSTSRRGTNLDGGHGRTMLIWGGETLLFALTPLLSALAGKQIMSKLESMGEDD